MTPDNSNINSSHMEWYIIHTALLKMMKRPLIPSGLPNKVTHTSDYNDVVHMISVFISGKLIEIS